MARKIVTVDAITKMLPDSVRQALLSSLSSTYAALNHAARHATGQPDAITPASIGAQPAGAYAPALGSDDNYVTDAEKLALHSHANKTALDAVSGTNTGDEPDASTSVKGIVKLATTTETTTGTDTTRATTPAGVKAALDAKTVSDMSTYAPIPTGTPDGTKYYKDDGTWATPPGKSSVLDLGAGSTDTAKALKPDGQGGVEWGDGFTGFLANTTTPATPTGGGGVLFVQDGALKFIGSSGTVTTIASA